MQAGAVRRRMPAVALLLVFLAACGAAVPALPKLAQDDVVLAFGDSLTYGTGASEADSYPAVLETLIGRKVVREGFSGETTEQGVERLPDLLEQYRPRLLLLCMGGNDMLRKLDAGATEANLRTMVRLARDRGIAVVLIGVPEPRLFAGAAPFYARIAGDYDLPLEGKILADLLYDNAYKSDHIHPNARGYRKMAEAVAALLKQAGAV